MRLVDDQRVVAVEPGVALRFRQQDAVGHELHERARAHLLGEAHLPADEVAEVGAQLARDAPRHRARRDPARLRAADQAGDAAPRRQAQLRQLRRLARPRFARDDEHGVRAQRGHDLVRTRRDRQRLVDAHVRHGGGTRGARGARALEALVPTQHARVVGGHALAREAARLRDEPSVVDREHLVGAQEWERGIVHREDNG